MFYSLTGKLVHIGASTAVVECGGVGFKCAVSGTTFKNLPGKGAQVTLYTYLHVREDALELFGFSSKDELDCFKLIISVNGVGAKVALSILTAFSPESLAMHIATGDSKSLTRAQGVGAKIAQRIVLELKDKVGVLKSADAELFESAKAVSASSNVSEAVSALVALGFSHSEASLAVGRLDSGLSVQELIKQGLKNLSGNL